MARRADPKKWRGHNLKYTAHVYLKSGGGGAHGAKCVSGGYVDETKTQEMCQVLSVTAAHVGELCAKQTYGELKAARRSFLQMDQERTKKRTQPPT